LRGKDAVSLGCQRFEKFLVIVGNFFDATLYVIIRFGVSLKWVLYSRTYESLNHREFCFVMNFDVE